ncbi:MAG: patatin-like phospholipase family protein [Campylobacterota bacterium]|nr:patatin-like phospholipase family protein [Campylobacterota bacterium]
MARGLTWKLLLVVLMAYLLIADSGTVKKPPNGEKTVSLVLGSGGARGYAHIGAIEMIEKQGYEIKSISGSSMGALVGGLYAAGKLGEFKKWILTLDAIEVVKLVNFSSADGGVVNGDDVYKKIERMIGDIRIEDLPITYTAVASDINNREEVWFQKGKLIDAIRASIAIPTILTPVIKDGMLLVDGGVLNPLPITPVLSDKTDLVIAVNLDANIPNPYVVKIPKKYREQQHKLYNEVLKLWNEASKLIGKDTSEKDEIDIFYVLSKTLDATQSVLSKHAMQGHRPDIIIDIPRDACEFYEFDQAYRLIETGKMAAREGLKKKNKD